MSKSKKEYDGISVDRSSTGAAHGNLSFVELVNRNTQLYTSMDGHLHPSRLLKLKNVMYSRSTDKARSSSVGYKSIFKSYKD